MFYSGSYSEGHIILAPGIATLKCSAAILKERCKKFGTLIWKALSLLVALNASANVTKKLKALVLKKNFELKRYYLNMGMGMDVDVDVHVVKVVFVDADNHMSVNVNTNPDGNMDPNVNMNINMRNEPILQGANLYRIEQ